jgi:hypothetical protein
MPGNQPNFSYFDYLDDSGNHWNVRGEDGGPATAVDGHTTDLTSPPFGAMTKRRHVRYVEYTAPNFRKYRSIVYTPTAYAAIATGDTVSVLQQGSATAVTYTLSAKIPERIPVPSAGRHLTDV